MDDVPDPDPRDGSVLVEAIAVGVCGTDVEIAEGKYGWAPPHATRLVLGATCHAGRITDVGFAPDVILECTGVGHLISDSTCALAPSGILCLTGIGHGGAVPQLATADVASSAVLKNNVVFGSVNANRRHRYKAGEALARADRSWLARLITRRETWAVGAGPRSADAWLVFAQLRYNFP